MTDDVSILYTQIISFMDNSFINSVLFELPKWFNVVISYILI